MNLKPKLQHIHITCSPTAELATYRFPAELCCQSQELDTGNPQVAKGKLWSKQGLFN